MEAQERSRVSVAVVGEEAALGPLEPIVGRALARFEPEVRVLPRLTLDALLPTGAPDAPLARVFLDRDFARGPLLVVVDDRRERVFLRVFPIGLDPETEQEQWLTVLETGLESLEAGMAIGAPADEALSELAGLDVAPDVVRPDVVRPDAAPSDATPEASPAADPVPTESADAPTPAPRSSDAVRVSATLGYSLVATGEDQWLHGPRLGVWLALPSVDWMRTYLDVAYRFGDVLRDEALNGRLDALQVEAGLALGGGQPRFDARLGVGFDVVLPLVAPASGFTQGEAVALDVFVSADARCTLDLTPDVALFLEVGVDVYVLASRWTRGEDVLHDPWPLRPAATVGVQIF